MSLHQSLKTKPGALHQHRNVLTRAERITRLIEQERFDPQEMSPLGLAKVVNRLAVTAKKKKAKQAEEGEGAATGEAADEKTPASS